MDYAKDLIVVEIFWIFSNLNICFLVFDLFSPEIGGSHLSKKVRETISMTEQCLPSQFLSVAPSYICLKIYFQKFASIKVRA